MSWRKWTAQINLKKMNHKVSHNLNDISHGFFMSRFFIHCAKGGNVGE